MYAFLITALLKNGDPKTEDTEYTIDDVVNYSVNESGLVKYEDSSGVMGIISPYSYTIIEIVETKDEDENNSEI